MPKSPGGWGFARARAGGGATYMVPGIAEAQDSAIAMVALTSDIAVASRGRGTLTDLDQQGLFRPITKDTACVDRIERLPALLRGAFQTASTARPGVAQVSLPFDVLGQRAAWDDWRGCESFGQFPAARQAPSASEISLLARRIRQSARPLFLCGGGVMTSGGEAVLARIASAWEIPVATTVSGKGTIADTHALAVGVVGTNGGTPATRAVVAESDLIVLIGCRAGSVTTERWRMPAVGTAIAHIDADPWVMGRNYPCEVMVIADAKLALEALAEELGEKRGDGERPDWGRARAARARWEKWQSFSELAASMERPIRPDRVVATLQGLLAPADTIVVDPGRLVRILPDIIV